MGLTDLLTDKILPEDTQASFWDHLDILRKVLFRSVLITVLAAVVAFCFKEQLFQVVLAPHSSDFFLFRWMHTEPFCLQLINVQLTEQFMMHMKTAVYVGILIASPYILYSIFGFVAPALYENERRGAGRVVVGAYAMFLLGTVLNYCVVFPLTVRFMGTYNVDPAVVNMLSLRSYIDTLLTMNLMMGLVFELPVICWILGRMGLLSARFMSQYRRHAIVIILIVAAIITPTTDMFTLLIVSLPIWLLYEMSIGLVAVTGRPKKRDDDSDNDPPEPPAPPSPDGDPDTEPRPDTEPEPAAEPDGPARKPDQPEPTPAPDTGATDDFLWEQRRLEGWNYNK